MSLQTIQKTYEFIDYLRLSDDDDGNGESNSISNQRILIQNYLKDRPEFVQVKECVDDGFTGTNFNRPGFQEMMRLLEEGKANCVICKDLSRFGRDFSGVLQYVERILPSMGVRLILLNDNYDSISRNHDFLSLRLKSFINDVYPADTSRSIRANLHAKMVHGQCVAPCTSYGFLKSPEDKHKLILDPVTGAVVRDIFHLKLKGHSLNEIAQILDIRGILTPYAYKKYLKQNFQTSFRKNMDLKWDAAMVKRILVDERFTGTLVQGKTTTPNYKVKKIIYKDSSEWVRKENVIEPAVDRHTFDVVQNLLGHDARKSANGIALLSGLVECADCRQGMVRKSPNQKYHYYVCSSSLYEKTCWPHSISEKKLTQAVKESLLYYISVIVELDIVLTHVKESSIPKRKLLEADRQMVVLRDECDRLNGLKKTLYESFCDNIIDENEFRTYKLKYNQQLHRMEAAIKTQQAEIEHLSETLEQQRDWMEYFLKYKDAEEIDRIMLVLLIKRIRVSDKKHICIDFWFSDEFEHTLSLLEIIDRAKPDSMVSAFLERKGGAFDGSDK